jgi:hypothetical protein
MTEMQRDMARKADVETGLGRVRTQMGQMQTGLGQVRTQMGEGFDRLNTRMDQLTVRMDARYVVYSLSIGPVADLHSERNMLAHITNAAITNPDSHESFIRF